MTGPILFLAAIRPEAAAVRRAVDRTGRVGVTVFTVGIRAVVKPPIDELETAAVVVMTGLAGAIDPALSVGDVVLDDPTGRLGSDAVRRGRVTTSDRIISTPIDKAKLFARTGAAVVDMEHAIVRGWTDRLGIPLIGLRVVSDSAHQTLDPAVLKLVDPFGRPKPLAITTTLLRRPTLIPTLNRLRADTAFALSRLELAIETLFRTDNDEQREQGWRG